VARHNASKGVGRLIAGIERCEHVEHPAGIRNRYACAQSRQ
jgi:hypothetical protein